MFAIEDWVEIIGGGKFERIPNRWFATFEDAHTEMERLKKLGKISEKAVVVLCSLEEKYGDLSGKVCRCPSGY